MNNTILEVLLIEDNEGDIVLVTEALEELSVRTHITVCRDGQKAINYLEEVESKVQKLFPHIVLLDINLPKKNGHEVLQFIKSRAGLKQIPVIMLTTSSSQKDINVAYDFSVNAFVTKPVDLETFARAIASFESFWLRLASLPVPEFI